ncbi:patatin-like phospholipase family protein [Microbacter margulisiae]|uniref:NTE family protein n=1 Tax=Microbacter margulisiae TaxID=1350067 RepID=A0A7W5DSS4_9PORP|nr:patatin-like phospholipase family protein [Microbacter margulisiae]MBB3187573.1 NTE family protein [Microbacter margulisiae]
MKTDFVSTAITKLRAFRSESQIPPYKLGLALSGGGIRGLAHLGIIQALEEHGLKPDILSGTSAGSIVGALYADGYSPKEIARFFQESKFFQWAKVALPKQSLISSEKLYKAVGELLHAETFEELSLPLVISMTDFTNGKPVFVESGPLLDIIIASSSIPIIFNPIEIGGKQYVDGGLTCNLPAKIIRPRCQELIGVHVNHIPTSPPLRSIWEIAERAYQITLEANTLDEKKVCNLVIEPTKVRKYGLFDVSDSQKVFDLGYDAGMKALDKYLEDKKLSEKSMTAIL